MMNEIQQFLADNVGRCDNCGHALKKITTMHVSDHYPSGLSLSPTHWTISEVDEDESTGIGCSQCEKGYMHAVHKDRFDLALKREMDQQDESWKNVYCVEDKVGRHEDK